MSKPLGWDARQSTTSRASVWQFRLLLSFLAGVASLVLLAGAQALASHFHHDDPRPYRAPCGLVMLLLGAVQATVAWRLFRHGRPIRISELRPGAWFERLAIGAFAAYLGILWIGPDPHLGYLYQAAAVLWYTILLLPIATASLSKSQSLGGTAQARYVPLNQPATASSWRSLASWHSRPGLRWARHGAFGFAALLATAEGGLRVYSSLSYDRVDATFIARQQALPPGTEFRGATVNQQGYWGREFAPRRNANVLRVAVLGDDAALAGDCVTNCLAQLEQRMPQVETYNFSVPDAGPREYAALLAHQVLQYQPDVVLTFVSIGDDVTHSLPMPHWSDLRGLHLYQVNARHRTPAGETRSVLAPPPMDREEYLNAAARRMEVCRAPILPATQARWNETFGYLNDIVELCRKQGVPTAFVLVPSDVQLDPQLRRTLCRRNGYDLDAIDVQLPQRRLTNFARERQTDVIDLWPHLQAVEEPVHDRNSNDWNNVGNRVAAEAIGRWLNRRFAERLQRHHQLTVR